MLSGLFPVQFFYSLPLFLLLTRSFTRFAIADELILISKRQVLFRHLEIREGGDKLEGKF